MHKLKGIAGAVIVYLSWSVCQGAGADTNSNKIETARKHMELGQEAFHQNRFEDAAKHFDDAYTAYNQVIALYGDTSYPPNAQYQKDVAALGCLEPTFQPGQS